MSLHKIWLILRSEFRRRVRSTAFLVATLLVPIGFVALATAPALFGYLAGQTGDRTIAIVDETTQLADTLVTTGGDRLTFRKTTAPSDSVRAAVRAGRYDGYLHLPDSLLDGPGEATYYSTDGGGLSLQAQLDDRLTQVVRHHRLAAAGASSDVRAIVNQTVTLTPRTLSEDEGTTANASLAYTVIGYIMAFGVYMAVFIYGQYVMQGVIEEKSTRVVEVIVSSVRPFELMMGKVLGIGAMGLAQMGAWALLVGGGLSAAGPVLALFVNPSDLGLNPGASTQAMRDAAGVSLPSLPLDLVVWFLLFFLGGFLLYAALFAAVGSAVEQQQDAQSLLLPVLFPLILPILFLIFVVESPNATTSVVMSMIPLFSPILMVLRTAIASVPLWQTATALLLLVAAFGITIWGAGRIYRVGILSYGQTPSLREFLRWITYE